MAEHSPVKLFTVRKLVVKPSLCLICGQKVGPYGRKPKEQGIAGCISALEIRNFCNNFSIAAYSDVIDF